MKFGPVYIDHIGIASHHLDDNSQFWSLIGLVQGEEDEIVEDQGVKTRFSLHQLTANRCLLPRLSCWNQQPRRRR